MWIMPIYFKDASQSLTVEYLDRLPEKTINLRIKGEQAYKLNLSALYFYGFYKNTIERSYAAKPDLAEDIKNRKKEYQESDGSKLAKSHNYNSPLHHYSVAASLGAMEEWQNSDGKMKAYIAYQNVGGHKRKIGFVHFTEQVVNGKTVVYIAQAGTSVPGEGIGRRLMQCVLSHFPADTEFYILTRVFNTEAKTLYQKRLSFTPIEPDEVRQLGYDDRYCGYKHTTTTQEIAEIASIKVEVQPQVEAEDSRSLQIQ